MSDGRCVFLTGATGFIGGRVAAILAGRGDRLRCLVRDAGRARALETLGAELVVGDVTDRAAHARGLEGADVAVHLAAIYDIGVVDAAALYHTNIDGTAAFLDAVQSARTPRALYVSTTVALGPVPAGIGDEATRNHPPYSSEYERTKTEAHSLALQAQQAGLPLIIICPAYVYGPGDNGPGGRFLRDLMRGRVPALLTGPAWFSFVHVDDVADGIVRALDQGGPGESYVLSGHDATINHFAQLATALAGVRGPLLRFPPPLALLTGRLLDGVARMTGARFAITAENVRTVSGHRWLHSHAKATAELGWQPRSLEAGLPETIAWLKTQGA
ncbi:MAG TPA: NAD-dependent epimerase/dehydratase family protein [Longimicrobiales bacterium]